MGQGYVQTCPEPRLGKLTNSSNKWNVPATQEAVWRFLAPAGWVGGRQGVLLTVLHSPPQTERKLQSRPKGGGSRLPGTEGLT